MYKSSRNERLIAFLLLAMNIIIIISGEYFYPALLFPSFKRQNDFEKKTIELKTVDLYAYTSDTMNKISFFQLFKPYDKRYVLFVKRMMAEGYKMEHLSKILFGLGKGQGFDMDSLQICVTKRNYELMLRGRQFSDSLKNCVCVSNE